MNQRPQKLTAGVICLCVISAVIYGIRHGTVRSRSETAGSSRIIETETGVKMVLVPGGSFEMGNEKGPPEERPRHTVRVDSFLMDQYEVTQEEYERLAFRNPSHFKDPGRPVERIVWADAALYCNARSRAEGLTPCYDEETGDCDFDANGYRLPTEAEWEYACRAGTETDYFFGPAPRGLSRHAWFSGNSSRKTHPVGRKKPNPWGLHDMYGNVSEWCNDFFDKEYYAVSPEENPRGPAERKRTVLRGGAWDSEAGSCRSSRRAGEDPGFIDACFASDTIGFRCVRRCSP